MIQYYVMRVQKEVFTMVSLTKRLSYFLMSMMLIVMTVFNTGLTVNAAKTCIGGEDAITIPVFLAYDAMESSKIPAESTFIIRPGEPVAATDISPEIKSGPEADINFKGDCSEIGVSNSYGDLYPMLAACKVTFDGSESYTGNLGDTYPIINATGSLSDFAAVKNITLDLHKVIFTKPGIYRYIITQSGSTYGIMYDTANTRYLDIYIISDEDGNLSVAPNGYVIHKTTDVFTDGSKPSDLPSNSDASTVTGGNSSFINKIKVFDYTLQHKTAGNQGSYNTYFKYTVNITGGSPTGHTVSLTNATANPKVNGIQRTNPTTITDTAVFYLKHKEKIVIKGIANGTSVDVTVEEIGHKPSYVHASAASVESNSMTAQVLTKAVTTVFTLSKSGTVPTGVFLNMMPWPILLLIAAAFLVYSQWRKARNRSQLM